MRISEKEIKQGRTSIRVEKEIQRLNAVALSKVGEGGYYQDIPQLCKQFQEDEAGIKDSKDREQQPYDLSSYFCRQYAG